MSKIIKAIINFFKTIIIWLISPFRKKKPAPTPTPTPIPTTIPHPEEPPDYSKTIDNTTTEGLLEAWFYGWNVPQHHQTWWRNEMSIEISLEYPSAAATISEAKQMWIRPEWANPGVLAHELAHVSHSTLTEPRKAEFSADYTLLKDTDPLIKLLYSQNTYGLTNDIEGHAEVYRYLGEQMPEQLKQYYPNMF
jgi:hypothetical protein